MTHSSETAPDAQAAAPRRTRVARVFAVSVLVAAALYVLKDTGPGRRLFLPSATAGAIGSFLKETLWNRAGYGAAAVSMIHSSPWFGVGLGMFAVMAGDYRYSHMGGLLVPDNAQNWFRHYLAELGVIGSLGWMAWAVLMVVWIAYHRARGVSRSRALPIAGALAGALVISQVGMPTENPAVAFTCWTFLFWYLVVSAPDATIAARHEAAPWWGWALVSAFVAVVAAGTWIAASTTLQVPMRARNAGRPYEYGFSRPELTASGEPFRWSPQYGVAVVPAPTRLVKLTVWTNRPDIATNPVQARVWHENHVVIDTVLRDHHPVNAYVVLDREPRWLMVRTYFDRFVTPTAPELGLAVQWTFLEPDSSDASSVLARAAR